MVSKKEKLIFLMPPRTASKSIKECLLDCSLDFEPFENTQVDTEHLYLSELVKYFDIDNLTQYKIIQVIRNPFDRFYSSYIASKTELPIDFFAERFYKSVVDGKLIDFVKEHYEGDSNSIMRTLLNQTQWNDMKADVLYLKLEDISKDIKTLSDEVGVYLPQLENFNKQDYDCINFSEKFIQIIEKTYKRDINNYGKSCKH